MFNNFAAMKCHVIFLCVQLLSTVSAMVTVDSPQVSFVMQLETARGIRLLIILVGWGTWKGQSGWSVECGYTQCREARTSLEGWGYRFSTGVIVYSFLVEG